MEGFIPHIIGNTETTAFEYVPAKAQAYVVGQALVWDATNGRLDYASGAVTPQYFAYTDSTVAANGDLLCVTRVRDDIIYETHASASLASVAIGSKVTLAAASSGNYPAGVRVTATTTSGTATILGTAAEPLANIADKAAGCKAFVKFEI